MINMERIARLARELERSGLDALYIGPSTDVEYIADLKLYSDERVKGLMISKDARMFAMTPLLYEEEMKAALGSEVIYQVWGDHEGFLECFVEGCEKLGLVGGRIAFNDGVRAVDLIRMRNAVNFDCADGSATLSPLRGRKDSAEMELMRRASSIADVVMEKISRFIRVGMKEADIKKKLAALFESEGCDSLSFSPIVAAGPGGSMPHYSREDHVIERGDFIVIDMGCRYNRYCSDMSRTFCVGEPDPEQRGVYETVLAAQIAGEAAVKPGAAGQDVDRAARGVIESAGYGKYFINRVGHGVGIAIHEEPYMVEGNETPLEPGNVFSIEPGIYIAGRYGVRIENLVAVRPDGAAETLNHFTRELIVI
jgi:Xaa-Pro aminopeptidase